jgi:hypothetical protein
MKSFTALSTLLLLRFCFFANTASALQSDQERHRRYIEMRPGQLRNKKSKDVNLDDFPMAKSGKVNTPVDKTTTSDGKDNSSTKGSVLVEDYHQGDEQLRQLRGLG